jgi:hypothetical protein
MASHTRGGIWQEAHVTRSISVVFLLALAQPALAQVNPAFADVSDAIEMVRSLVRMERKAVVEQNMQLTPAESQAFWSVYNEYEAERTRVNDRAVKVVTDYAAAYPEVGDARAKALLAESFDVEADVLALKKSRKSSHPHAWRDSSKSNASWTPCKTCGLPKRFRSSSNNLART